MSRSCSPRWNPHVSHHDFKADGRRYGIGTSATLQTAVLQPFGGVFEIDEPGRCCLLLPVGALIQATAVRHKQYFCCLLAPTTLSRVTHVL
jgi:hypothetical protein